MGTTDVQVCNRALRHCRGSRITSLDDNSEAARACKEVYNDLRTALLQSHPWNFAMRRAELAALASVPVWEFDAEYQLPTGCLALREIQDYFLSTDYQVENGKILINDSGPIYIKYTLDVSAGEFTPLFAEVLALLIATRIIPTIQNSGVKKRDLMDDFKRALSEAKRADGIENPPDQPVEDTWLLDRLV